MFLASLIAAAALANPVITSRNVDILPDGIAFTTTLSNGSTSTELLFFAFADGGQVDPASPLGGCIAAAQATCGAGKVKSVKVTYNPTTGDQSCSFECATPSTTG